MVDRILVPLDGSPRAEQILAQVARLLKREDAEVIALRVADIPYSLARTDTARLLEEERVSSAPYLKRVVDTLQGQGVRARALRLEGPAADSILKAAGDVGATLIALSTHGRAGLARWALGSVAEKVVRGAPVPVLLMRSFKDGPKGLPLPAGPEERPFRRILVPVDGSETSLSVVPAAAAFAARFEAEIDVLSVEMPLTVPMGAEFMPPTPPATMERARDAAEKAVARFQEKGLRARAATRVGDPAGGILDASKDADLIAMATHGWTGVTRWVLGSVTERVLRHATLPMLIVRAPDGLKG